MPNLKGHKMRNEFVKVVGALSRTDLLTRFVFWNDRMITQQFPYHPLKKYISYLSCEERSALFACEAYRTHEYTDVLSIASGMTDK